MRQGIEGTRGPITTTLLAAACAGMLSSTTAKASTFVESTDFGNDFSSRTTVDPGTHRVQGTLQTATLPTDFTDYFRLTGLPGNQPMTINYFASTTATNTFLTIQLLNDSEGFIAGTTRSFQPSDGVISGSFQIAIPANGVLVPSFNMNESGSGVVSYTLEVPEPTSTAALLGLGALALLGRRKSDPPQE